MTEAWESVDDVGGHLGVARNSVYRWIDSKGLPAPKPEVDEWARGGGANEQPAKHLPPARKGKPGRKR